MPCKVGWHHFALSVVLSISLVSHLAPVIRLQELAKKAIILLWAKTVYDQACSRSHQKIDRDQSKHNNNINSCPMTTASLIKQRGNAWSYCFGYSRRAKLYLRFVSRISPFPSHLQGRNEGSPLRDLESQAQSMGSQPRDPGSQVMGSGSAEFDQGSPLWPCFWDQGVLTKYHCVK